jgi:hypothetical protein
MSSGVTGSQVFEILVQQDGFVNVDNGSKHDVWRVCCDACVAAVGEELLSEIVNPETFIRAKMAVLGELVGGHWFLRVFGDNPAGSLGELLGTQIFEMTEEISKDVPAFLRDQGFSEEQFFLHRKIGRFDAVTHRRWLKGGLTIGELFVTQPGVFFHGG